MSLPPHRSGHKLSVASTGGGKTTDEIKCIVGAAEQEDVIIVAEDPHEKSLCWESYKQLVGRGHERRIRIDKLSDPVHALKYAMLPRSRATDPLRRMQENQCNVRHFMEVLGRRQDARSFAGNPLKEEWLYNSGMLLVESDRDWPAHYMQYALRPKHRIFTKLLDHCLTQDIVDEFRQLSSGAIKPGMYAPARRAIDGVCQSVAFRRRDGTDDWLTEFFDSCGILLIEGGTSDVSDDDMRMILGCISLQVIHYLRTRWNEKPRLLHVLDEANNAGLIGAAGHETRALAELRKAGYDCHILVQLLNFPGGAQVTQEVLANTIEHHWFYNASANVLQAAANDLGDQSFKDRIRRFRRGEKVVKRLNDIYFERVVPLDDPWGGWPGLSERKAKAALARTYQHPEYGRVEEPQDESEASVVAGKSTQVDLQPVADIASPAERVRQQKKVNPPDDAHRETPTGKTGVSLNECGRERAVALADTHVVTLQHLVSLFTSRKTAYRAIAALRDAKKLRHVGGVMLSPKGRPVDCFCNGYQPKRDQLRHEVLITDFFLIGYPIAENIRRGWHTDRTLRADAEFTLHGIQYLLEMDTGMESYAQVERHQRALAAASDFILYVTTTARRVQGLIKHSERIRDLALFTTLEQVLAEPKGAIWIDSKGKSCAI